jgi:hypothetical protein
LVSRSKFQFWVVAVSDPKQLVDHEFALKRQALGFQFLDDGLLAFGRFPALDTPRKRRLLAALPVLTAPPVDAALKMLQPNTAIAG